MSASRRERMQAMRILEQRFEELLESLTAAVLENAEDLQSSTEGYSYAAQELEERFGPKLMTMVQLLGPLKGTLAQPEREELRFEQVVADTDELATVLNRTLAGHRGWNLRDLNLQKTDDGRFLALLTLTRKARAR